MLTPTEWCDVAHSLTLSARQLRIVRSMFDDKTEGEIAEKLGISSHTVHGNILRLYHKLGVRSRVQILLRVFKAHLALEDQ